MLHSDKMESKRITGHAHYRMQHTEVPQVQQDDI